MKRFIKKGKNGLGHLIKDEVIYTNEAFLIKRFILIDVSDFNIYIKHHFILLKRFKKKCLMYKSFSIKESSMIEILNMAKK